MSPKPSVKEERTQEIVEAAMKVFAREGFHHATMDHIAEETGVSKGTLYLYFPSKDEIIFSLLEWFFQKEYSNFEKLGEGEISARGKIEKVTQTFLDGLLAIRPFIPVMYEFFSLSARNPRVGEAIRNSLYGFMEQIQPVFEKGVENREFKNLDPESLVFTYGALIEGTLLIWSCDVEKIDLRETLTNSLKIFFDGIMKEKIKGD